MSESETHQQAGPGLVAGRYLLLRELGRGGMGTVWLADDQLVARQVAVKELRPLAGLPDAELAVFRQRALREAASAARIRHPGAVTLYDVIPATAADDAVYLIMEYIEGLTLDQLITAGGRLPDAVVAAYGLQLLDVLAAAHSLGVVHRDVKPANIMITPGGQVKLTDFGIAHVFGDANITNSGVMGTQAYMAPELFESVPATPPADLWSLGATLYHASHGSGPFDRGTAAATLRAIIIDDVPAPHCSPALAAAITGMLQRDPGRRVTIEAAAAQLRQASPGQSAPSLEQTITTRAPSSPPRQEPSSAPTGPTSRPRRPRLLIAVGAALVIAIAAGVTGGILAARPGGTPPGPGSTAAANKISVALRASAANSSYSEVTKMAFSSDGTLLAIDTMSGPVVLLNAANGAVIASLPSETGPMALRPDGHVLGFLNSQTEFELWNTADRSPIGVLNSDMAPDDAAFSPDGTTLAMAGDEGIQLWDASSRTLVATLTMPGSATADTLVFSPDGKTLAAGNSLTGNVYLWNLSSRTLVATVPPAFTKGLYGLGSWMAFSPDGAILAIAGNNAVAGTGIRLWDIPSRTWGASLDDPGSMGVPGIAFSPDGTMLAAADASGTVYLWDVRTGKVVATQAETEASDVAFSADGKTLAVGSTSQVALFNVSGASGG
jgi:serine/threonine protein kinase